MSHTETVDVIRRLAKRVQEDDNRIGALSTGEFLAVALVLNRFDLLGSYTMLEAVHRLGEKWFNAAIEVQRAAWKDENGKLVFE